MSIFRVSVHVGVQGVGPCRSSACQYSGCRSMSVHVDLQGVGPVGLQGVGPVGPVGLQRASIKGVGSCQSMWIFRVSIHVGIQRVGQRWSSACEYLMCRSMSVFSVSVHVGVWVVGQRWSSACQYSGCRSMSVFRVSVNVGLQRFSIQSVGPVGILGVGLCQSIWIFRVSVHVGIQAVGPCRWYSGCR